MMRKKISNQEIKMRNTKNLQLLHDYLIYIFRT